MNDFSAGDRLEPGVPLLVMADEITVLVTPSQSEGRILVVEIGVPPGGGPPPLHTHPPDELFHVIQGSVSLFRRPATETERIDLLPGASAFVPGGVPHTFRNLGDAPARLLCTFTPGPMMAAFFATTGRAPGASVGLAEEIPRVLHEGAALGLVTLDEVPA